MLEMRQSLPHSTDVRVNEIMSMELQGQKLVRERVCVCDHVLWKPCERKLWPWAAFQFVSYSGSQNSIRMINLCSLWDYESFLFLTNSPRFPLSHTG